MEALINQILEAINTVVLFISDINNGLVAGVKFIIEDIPELLEVFTSAFVNTAGAPLIIVVGFGLTITIFGLRFILLR